jgi:phosphoribosylanthranilate isomerase
MRIKICGITNAEDAALCVEAGADALGFNFVAGTPRFVTAARAAAIVAGLPPFVTPVGIFWDSAPGHVKALAEECGLRALQFHGDEPPEALAEHRLPVIKTIKVAGESDLDRMARYEPAAFLLDSTARWSEGEARVPISWAVARRGVAMGRRIILAAGLTPDNVAAAIRVVGPYAVDVASGVEAVPGRKDPDKVRRFVCEARAATGPAESRP